jgi:hypothetical protein
MGVSGSQMIFGSNELGLSYPIFLGNQSASSQAQLKDLSLIRLAFPKYVERPLAFSEAQLVHGNQQYKLELAQNINGIAFQSLKDRMMREIGNNILRIATKQAIEQITRNENENLGALVSIVNAVTEKADTRNWQSLPYALYYTRVQLPAGEQTLTLQQRRIQGKVENEDINVKIEAGLTTFRIFHQLESAPLPAGSY